MPNKRKREDALGIAECEANTFKEVSTDEEDFDSDKENSPSALEEKNEDIICGCIRRALHDDDNPGILDLSGVVLRIEQVKLLIEALTILTDEDIQKIKIIKLGNIDVCDEGLRHICQFLNEKRWYGELDVSQNKVGYEAAQAIASLMQGACLSELTMYQVEIENEAFCVILQTLVENPKLKVLDIGGNTINTTHVAILVTYFVSEESTVEEFQCDSVEGDLDEILVALCDNNSVIATNFSKCIFTDKDFNALEKLFSSHTPLTSIALANCGITGERACRIGKALKQNKNIEVIDFSDNPIYELGAQAILDAAKQDNSRLCLVEISDSFVGDNLIEQIKMACAKNEKVFERSEELTTMRSILHTYKTEQQKQREKCAQGKRVHPYIRMPKNSELAFSRSVQAAGEYAYGPVRTRVIKCGMR